MEGNQGASLPWNLGRLKGFFYLILELWRPRGFFTLIWMKGNQRASLPRNLGRLKGFSISILNYDDQGASLPQNLGWLRGFSISILNYGDQGVSLPRSERKVAKTLELGAIERLLYLNLELWRPRGFSTLIWMEGNYRHSILHP